jgi:hypothetical protein
MRKIFLRIALAFVISFFLNLMWENAHSFLYDNYKGGTISAFILARAALGDALMITIISLPFIVFKKMKRWSPLIIAAGFILAYLIEYYALSAGRWAYDTHMPIVPLLNIGLTPFIQLALLGYISYKISTLIQSPFCNSPRSLPN